MAERKLLSIGAHPDDADTFSAGLLYKLFKAGWEIRMLSITDGSAGSFRDEMDRETLAAIRREEAKRSGEVLNGRYDVWDYPDGRLEVSLEARERLIGYIREYSPDVIITNRPNDYHADHRSASILVQDASYLLTVPHIVPEVKYLKETPAILFWQDDFKKPYPHCADIMVPVTEEGEDMRVSLASRHVSQYFDWMYWPNNIHKAQWEREDQIRDLEERFKRGGSQNAEMFRSALIEKYGEAGKAIKYLETYEISEYGGAIPEDFIEIAESCSFVLE